MLKEDFLIISIFVVEKTSTQRTEVICPQSLEGREQSWDSNPGPPGFKSLTLMSQSLSQWFPLYKHTVGCPPFLRVTLGESNRSLTQDGRSERGLSDHHVRASPFIDKETEVRRATNLRPSGCWQNLELQVSKHLPVLLWKIAHI